MPRIHRAATLLLIASVALAGCSTPAPTGSPSSSSTSAPDTAPDTAPEVAPAAGETVTGTGYSFSVPENWGVPPDSESMGADTIAADLTDADGFADNVNVLLSPAGEITPDQVESEGVDELEGGGATGVTVKERITIAGSESAHLSAALTSDGVDYQIEQFYLTRDGSTYVVTFSFSADVAEAERDALAEAVLATWTWN